MTNHNVAGSTNSRASSSPDESERRERRRAPRRLPGFSEALRRVRSRTGHELDVVDLSDAGLLVEGRARLLPNTHLDIHIVLRTGRVLVRCRVMRASVWYLERDLVRYRVGLAFDVRLDTSPGYPLLDAVSRNCAPTSSGYPDQADIGPPGAALNAPL
jgi:hypothetical protein